MQRPVALALATVVACGARATPIEIETPDAGVTIALYASDDDSYAVVDDRRWIEVTGERLLVADIDPGAELASLVIEPASRSLEIGTCTREPVDVRASVEQFVPAVTCAVHAPRGRYLVRLLYVTREIGYRAQHDIDMRDPERARVTSRYAITTPVWRTRAELVVHDGLPGAARPPRVVARGLAVLDGSTAVLAVAARDVPARLRRIYEGAVVTSPDSSDPMWAHDSAQAIWVWLELAGLRLPPGPIRAHLELPGEGIRDVDVATPSRRQDGDTGAPLRLPLWVDESLRGSRGRVIEYNDGAALSERLLFGVANTGEDAREVFVTEPLRKASRRRIDRAWPVTPSSDGRTLRTRLEIRPGQIVRTGYTVTYEF